MIGDSLKKLVYRALGFFCFALGFLGMLNNGAARFHRKVSSKGQLTFPFVQRRVFRAFQIITFHGIGDGLTPFLPRLPVETFQAQMEYLVSHFQILELKEAVCRMKHHDIPENSIVLTFDDGYRDNYLNAFPILKNLGITATFFLPTDVIGTGEILWHDQACWLIAKTKHKHFEGYGGLGRFSLKTRFDQEIARDGLLLFLRTLSDLERKQYIKWLFEVLEVSSEFKENELMLNWREVQEMHKAGMQFGAHTLTHPILSKLSIEQAKYEIRESGKVIQTQLDLDDIELAFAYPSGRKEDYNNRIKEIVEAEGYYCAVSTVWGANGQEDDLFELKRMGCDGSDIDSFRLRFCYHKFCN